MTEPTPAARALLEQAKQDRGTAEEHNARAIKATQRLQDARTHAVEAAQAPRGRRSA